MYSDATTNKMGRWGMRLFEGDQDLDIALEINTAFGDSDDKDLQLSPMVHQTDMAHYKTDEYKKELEGFVSNSRSTLNSGIGDELFKLFRKREHERNGKYRVIIVGAIMMRAGAVIKDDDLNHLCELVPEIPSRDGLKPVLRNNPALCSPSSLLEAALDGDDWGFRHPGKVQFLTALENYKPGVPRSFQEPSCYNCGKIAADSGEEILLQCSKCKRVWYCNVACQRAHWKNHKSACIPPEDRISLNV
ncbi:hypothetical protein N8I77_003195 [Diaporthe amygdali]|uniref:MYND-type domain-containing protein n=1 Tax=Phomopsis amygdali TaxID=1214568 RepID=A0AAD9SJP6_PHOAM|nr:hypothetical protein N8I77_003195 [Diaporthe amygdali]